jgi:hypothetical protein
MNQSFRVNAPDVTFEAFDTEVLVINLRNGNYYSLRESATVIWQLAAQGQASAAIAQALARSCQAPTTAVAAAVDGLIKQLVAELLLVPQEGAPETAASQPPVTLPTAFVAPVFDRYTDMQQLLLVDPIHEVDQSGWPKVPESGPR